MSIAELLVRLHVISMAYTNSTNKLLYFSALAAVALGLYLCSLYSYLLFHSLIEITTIAIGFTLFILTWNSRRFMANESFKVIGIGYAFTSVVDLLHTLAYSGMGVFPGYGSNLPTELWVAARYLQAAIVCAAPFFVERKIKNAAVFTGCFVAVSFLLALIYSNRFPTCYIEGKGLTEFKIFSEYVITAILVLSLFLFYRKRQFFNSRIYLLVLTSIAFTALAEISFTAYFSVYGLANLIGHFLKLTSFYLIYRAVLVTGLREPFDLVFRDLKKAEENLRAAHQNLEDTVMRRTAELQASENKYRALIDCANDAVLVNKMNKDGSQGAFVEVNELACCMLGYTKEQLLRLEPAQVTAPRDQDLMDEITSRLLTESRAVFETALITADRKSVPVEVSSRLLCMNGVRFVISLIRDITERKSAHRRLTLTHFAMNHVRESAFLVDANGFFVDVNAECCRSLGYSSEELLSMRVGEVDPDMTRERWRDHWNRLRVARSITLEGRHKTKDGRIIPVEISANYFQYEGESYNLGLVRDITDRRRTEEQLREEEERFRLLYEEAPIPYQSLDTNGCLLSANQAWLDALGYRKDEVTGTWFGDFLVDHQRELFKARFPKFKATGQISGVEFKMVRRDGGVIDVSFEGRVAYDEHHNFKQTHCVFRDITERKRAEEESALLASIVRSSDDAIIGKNLEGTITSWNGGAERIYGYTAAEMVGKTITLLVPPTCEDELAAILQGLKSGQHVKHFETFRRRKDGRLIQVSLTVSPLVDADGTVIGASTIARDISERKRIEEALKASEGNYRSLFEESLDCVFVTSPDGRILDINKKGITLFGYENKEEMQELVLQRDVYTHPEQRQRIMEMVRIDGSAEYEIEIKKKSGDTFIAQCSLYATQDPSGAITSYRGTLRDITEKKRAEENLRQANQEWERTFDAVTDIVFVQDSAGQIVRANKAMCERLAMKAEEIVGMRCFELMHNGQTRPNRCPRELMLDDLSNHSGEISDSPLGGCFAVNVSPIRDGEGRFLGSVHVARDITETKRLQELESRAQRLDTAGRIAGQVAHDLNNLLAPITAYPDLIRETLPPESPALEFVDIMEKAGSRIADINQQLLTLSRRGHYSQGVVNLNAIIKQALTDLGPLVGNLSCAVELMPDLLNIHGGGAQLHRVMLNLLVNARDAISSGGTITVKTENVYVDETSVKYNRVPKGEFVKVTISDTGTGIPPEIIEKIFDPFFTTKTADKKRGSGLGLNVVDAVIKDHGGYLDLCTEVGKGTSFYLYFPVTHAAGPEPEDATLPRGQESLLVVDDDDVQRDVLTRLLSSLGYRVVTCESGDKAIEELRKHPHDLMILDMIMPNGLNGVETYRKAVALNPEQRAIIVSGFSETEKVREAQTLGAGAFIKKPLNRRIIAKAVREELDKVCPSKAVPAV